MHVRSILTGILPLLLGGVLVTACDKKDEAKPDDKKADAKADEKKADEVKADEVKADEGKADEAKADAKADDMKADAAADAGADGASEEGGEPAEPADDAKADEGKADEAKAAADEKKDDKADAKKTDAKKTDAKKADDKAEPASKIDGKDLYSKKCASCHGGSGKADTKLGEKYKMESFTEPGWKGKWSVAKIENIVTNGESGTKMKAFKDKLTPEEIKAVSKYAHGLGK